MQMSTITQPICRFRWEPIRWPINVHVAVDGTFGRLALFSFNIRYTAVYWCRSKGQPKTQLLFVVVNQSKLQLAWVIAVTGDYAFVDNLTRQPEHCIQPEASQNYQALIQPQRRQLNHHPKLEHS